MRGRAGTRMLEDKDGRIKEGYVQAGKESSLKDVTKGHTCGVQTLQGVMRMEAKGRTTEDVCVHGRTQPADKQWQTLRSTRNPEDRQAQGGRAQ